MHTLNLSEEQINIILSALAERPYRLSAPVINEIHTQVKERQQMEESNSETNVQNTS